MHVPAKRFPMRAIERFFHIEIRSIRMLLERWINLPKGVDQRLAVISDEVLQTPCVRRLIDENLVAARDQLRGDSPEKMGVPVVPVRKQRVVEERDFHARAGKSIRPWRASSTWATWRCRSISKSRAHSNRARVHGRMSAFKKPSGRSRDYQILGLHHVPPGHPQQFLFDILFLLSGVLLFGLGWKMARNKIN